MKKVALILALLFPLTTGMALTSAFAFRLLPLSTDPCYIAKEGTPHFVAIPLLMGWRGCRCWCATAKRRISARLGMSSPRRFPPPGPQRLVLGVAGIKLRRKKTCKEGAA